MKITRYTPIVRRLRYYSEFYKQEIETGNLYKWTFDDSRNRVKMYLNGLTRTRRMIRELSELNTFSHFLTVTFPRKVVNAENAEDVERTWKNFTKRMRYHFNGFEFLSVPEFHKDEKGIHVHCMCNFGREPKLQYIGRTPKGQPYYHFHAEEIFKRSDVFCTIEKLTHGNNVDYLIKYMTKGHVFPFKRRYATSRGLKRRQLRDVIRFDQFFLFDKFAADNGFKTVIKSERTASYIGTQPGGVAAGLDLSKDCTKGEKQNATPEDFATWFYDLIAHYWNALKMRSKIAKISWNPPKPRPRVYVQDSFLGGSNA